MKKSLITLFLLSTAVSAANASVVLGGTRVIYEGNKKEASITVRNDEKTPYLVQSWVNNFDDKNTAKPPFSVTPPLFRIEPESANAIRVVLTTPGLPEDRESVYWLNVKSIPPSDPAATNNLTISVNNKIELIYRPAGLPSADAATAYTQLRFEKKDSVLQATNPTPYYVSFGELKAGNTEIEHSGMVPPKGTASWNISGVQANSVTWNAVNDYSSITENKTQQLN